MLSEGWPISWCHEATTTQSTAYRHMSPTGGVSIDSKRSHAACAPSSRPDSPEGRALARVEDRVLPGAVRGYESFRGHQMAAESGFTWLKPCCVPGWSTTQLCKRTRARELQRELSLQCATVGPASGPQDP